jgi:hypothetical protein
MKIMLRTAMSLVVLCSVALLAQAGVVIQQEGGEVGSKEPKHKGTLYLDSGKMRMETVNPDGTKDIMIFDSDKQLVWNIRPDGTYTEIGAAQVQQMSQQMNDMMKQMEARMAQMPPEQRKMMEDMMKQRMGGAPSGPPAPPTVQEKGSERVGPYSTTHYELQVNGQRTSEIWAAAPGQLHLQDADFKAFQNMAKLFEPLARNAPRSAWSPTAMEQIKGFPVKTVQYDAQQRPVWEWDVLNAESRSLESSLFVLPSGLRKTEMMPPGGPGRPMGPGGMRPPNR